MDIGPTIRPSQQPAPVTTRPDPQPVREAVAAELSPEKTVTAPSESQAARVEISRTAEALNKAQKEIEATRREVTQDNETNELVFRETNTKTGEVVQQIPDEAILRLRAYVAATQNLGSGSTGGTERQDHVALKA